MSIRSLICLSLVTLACAPAPTAPTPDAIERLAADWPDFPAERDLAILLPLSEAPLVPATTSLGGGSVALPSDWVRAVGEAYLGTVVDDGFLEESWYEDWRLVSVRVSPCAPVGRSPALAPASVCWPVVRLVWQPVVDFMDRGGVQLEAWADDRAIHAIYPVQPRDLAGYRVDVTPMSRVTAALEDGAAWSDLASTDQLAFELSRDRTSAWLLDRLAALRDPALPVGRRYSDPFARLDPRFVRSLLLGAAGGSLPPPEALARVVSFLTRRVVVD